MRRPLEAGVRETPRCWPDPFAANPDRRQPTVVGRRRPLRRGAVISRADVQSPAPSGRQHGLLQEPPGVAAASSTTRLPCSGRDLAPFHGPGSRCPRPNRRHKQVQRPTRPSDRLRRRGGRRRRVPSQGILPDGTHVQHLLPASQQPWEGQPGGGLHFLHARILLAAGTGRNCQGGGQGPWCGHSAREGRRNHVYQAANRATRISGTRSGGYRGIG